MGQAKIGKQYKTWALVVDEQELRRICDELQTVLGKAGTEPVAFTFEVRLSDQFSYSTDSIDELLKEENSRGRSINGLEIKSASGEKVITMRLGLEADRVSSLSVVGQDRQWVYVTYSILEDRLKRLKQWHPRTGVCVFAGTLTGLALLIWTMSLLLEKYEPVLGRTGGGKTELTGLGAGVGLALGAILVVGLVCMAKLFPNMVFRIGDGIRRHDATKSVRSRLFWLLLGSVGLGTLFRVANTLLW